MPLHRRLYRKRNFGLITLDAFPKTHQSKDLKLSFDRKELAKPAVGFGTVGDEDMMDHEESFRSNGKKQRLNLILCAV